MGLDIGFYVYKKEIDEKTKKIKLIQEKLTEAQKDDTWLCGRCDVTNAWDYGFEFNSSLAGSKDKKIDIVPTFDKDLDSWISPKSEYGYQYQLKYMPFEDYKKWVMGAVQEEYDNHSEMLKNTYKCINENNNKIKHYEELQLKCTKENEFAFDKWQEKIEALQDDNTENWSIINDDDPDNEDYDYSHAKGVERLIKNMEEWQKKGYITIPYYSF